MNTGSSTSNYNFDNYSSNTTFTGSNIATGINTQTSTSTGINTGSHTSSPTVETMDLSFATAQVANESKSILDKIGDFFGDLIDGAKETGAKIVNGAKSIITDGLNGLSELGSNIVSAAATLASNTGSLLSNLATWGLETAKKVGATATVVGTSIVSGVANIGEGLVDGLTWCGGKVVEGGSWIVGKIAGLFSDEAEQSVMEWREAAKTDVKEFISTDWIGKANDWFYQETELGQAINESSYLKYDSKLAKGITTATEMVGKIIVATAATFIPGGAVAAPLILGFTSGVGEKSEQLYQENINTTGAQELGIFISGLGEAANWYAQSKLGEGALGLINNIKTAGLKQTGSMIWSGVKSAAKNIKTNGVINTLKGAYKSSSFASLKAADNLADSVGIIGDNISDWLTGEEEFNFTNALKASGELVSAWILNMGMDGLSDYLSSASKQTDELIKTATDLEVDNGSSLGARFDEFTTGKNGTYGVDQGACRRMTYTEVLNSDWLKDPDDFKIYLKEKLPNWSEADLDDAFKTFTEGPRINDKGKEIVIEYIQRNNADYQSAMDAFKKSFNSTQTPDYTKMVQKYIDAGMSEADAIYLLKTIDTTGVCSYAAAANGIAASFAENPQLFKEVFGYDLYKTIDGQQVINSSELLSDLYVYANLDTNGGKLFTMVDGKLTYLNKDFSQQVYLSGSTYTRDDILDGFLKSKSSDLGYTDNIRIFTNQDQFILRGMDDSTNYTIDDVKKTFNEVLQTNSNVQLGVYRSKNNQFTFYNMDGTVNVTTNSWNEGGGHAVFITGMTDEGVIVSSWGEKLLIKYEDFINNRYNIAWGEISGITPATASSLAPTQGTTKIITEGVGDGASIGEYKNVTPFTPAEGAETYYGIPSKSTYTAQFIDDTGISHQKTYYLSGSIKEGQATGVIKHMAQASDESFSYTYKKSEYLSLLYEAKNNATDEEIIKIISERIAAVNDPKSLLCKEIDSAYVRIDTGKTDDMLTQMILNEAIGLDKLEQLETLEITTDKLQTLLRRSGLTEQYDAIIGSNASYEQKMEQLHFLASEGASKIYAKTLDEYAKGNFEEYMGIPIYIDPKVDEKPYYIEILTRPVNGAKGENVGNPVEAIKHMLHKSKTQTIPKAATNQGKKTINAVLSTKMDGLLQEQMLTGTTSTSEICESLAKLAIDDVTLPEGAQYIASPKYRDYAINEINKIANSNGTLQKIQDSIKQLSE